MALRAISSSVVHMQTYDVFLSFRGEDTRQGFVGYLYNFLRQRGINAFIDDESLRSGEEIETSLFKAIQESRIAIIVFSKNYASSTFCLDELAKILECFEGEDRLVLPVFYQVDPSDVRHQRGSYGIALAQLQERFKDNKQKVQKWRLALSEAANLSGWHLKPGIGYEYAFIERITGVVSNWINHTPLHVAQYPVGLKSRMHKVTSLLDPWSDEKVIMVGICGTGGIGKSTIASAIYNSIAGQFEGLCFLSNVREISKKDGLLHLQETLLYDLIREKDLKLGDIRKGIPIIAKRLQGKKILLILDDVDKLEQLRALVGSCDWFGSGSRIIITTRDRQLLVSHGVKRIYDVQELNYEEALQLLSYNAFKRDNVDSSYMKVAKRAIRYSCGLPLALEVFGSNLCAKTVDEWSSALDACESIPNKVVFEVLKLSYDALEDYVKEIFLDLACFFNNVELRYLKHELLILGRIQPEYAIGVLIEKSLLKIKGDHVTMHDLIKDMGKEIVRRQSPTEPGRRRRLWYYEDILHVLEKNTGTEEIEIIILDLPKDKEVQWSGKAFMKMKNLKMLMIKSACFSRGPKYLPNSLIVLEWKGYPIEFLPSNFHPTKLVRLDLSNNCCKSLRPFTKKFENLSHMNFKNCTSLRQIPNLSGACNLRELWLDGCTNLIEIHDSVGFLDKLKELSAKQCENLRTLPRGIKLTSLEHLNLLGCSSLESFPEILDKMKKMRILYLSRTAIKELPSSICNLIGLKCLAMDWCHHLKQLPASICMLPDLCSLSAHSCGGMRHFNICEGGEKASSYSSTMSSKLQHFLFSNCKLSCDSVAFCLSYFTNMIDLDLRSNNFTTLPACIEDCHRLKYLLLDNCKHLQHILAMPPNLEKFSAIGCTSLTKLSKGRVLHQAYYQQPRERIFIIPEKEIPKGLNQYRPENYLSFWPEEFPSTFLWVFIKDDQEFICTPKIKVRIDNSNPRNCSLSSVITNHIYICDLQSAFNLPLAQNWNEFLQNSTWEMRTEGNIYLAVHRYRQENIRLRSN